MRKIFLILLALSLSGTGCPGHDEEEIRVGTFSTRPSDCIRFLTETVLKDTTYSALRLTRIFNSDTIEWYNHFDVKKNTKEQYSNNVYITFEAQDKEENEFTGHLYMNIKREYYYEGDTNDFSGGGHNCSLVTKCGRTRFHLETQAGFQRLHLVACEEPELSLPDEFLF